MPQQPEEMSNEPTITHDRRRRRGADPLLIGEVAAPAGGTIGLTLCPGKVGIRDETRTAVQRQAPRSRPHRPQANQPGPLTSRARARGCLLGGGVG